MCMGHHCFLKIICLVEEQIFYIFAWQIYIYIFIFRERGREREREGEKHQCVVASRTPPTGDLACNPDMCPDWESNQQPFGSQAHAQSIEPHQPGLVYIFVWVYMLCTESCIISL